MTTPTPRRPSARQSELIERVLWDHELVGKAAPALDGHVCQIVTFAGEDCGCQRLVIGCTGCDWTVEAQADPRANLAVHRKHQAEAVAEALAAQPAADGLEAALRELHKPGPILTHGDECSNEDHEHSPTSHSFGEDMCLDCPRSGEQCCTHCSDFNDDLVPYPCPTIALLPGGTDA